MGDNSSTGTDRWHVVYTQPQKEELAAVHLQQQSFKIYLPRYERIKKHARKVTKVTEALFPRYLFINFDASKTQWLKVNSTRGVVNILTNSQLELLTVPEKVILGLQSQQNEEGLVNLGALTLFTKGDMLQVIDGPFKYYQGKFEKMTADDRVQLLIMMLNQYQKIELPVSMVEKV